MRIFFTAVLFVAFSYIPPSLAQQFSADAFIADCLHDSIRAEQKQACRGFFYGLISKKQHLLTPDKTNGVVDRAMNNRTPTASYAAVTKRALGIEKICLPNNLTYEDFNREFKQYMKRTQKDSMSIDNVTAALAQAYSC